MNTGKRPDPDEILRAVQNDELASQSGKLRVFLGMAAGVGKTYSMLKAAHQKKSEGVDVVIGFVETHGRTDTVQMVLGLEVLPCLKIHYRGTDLYELDLDSILKRKPAVVIIDELPHTNAPGMRHKKRFQDVYEILNAGIDVYTALNVQHLESRKDAVESITGIPIRETVPDGVLDRAQLIELVDIAPTELLKRLHEGKIYLGDRAEAAAQNFFKEDKLTALREIALRMTAEYVDQDLSKFTQLKAESSHWRTRERLLVGLSHSPSSAHLLRATRRLAYNLEAPWIALHVDTGQTLTAQDQIQLTKNLSLAKELNAKVISLTETHVASAIEHICARKKVTQVIVGQPTRHWIRDLFEGGSLVQQLLKKNVEFDIHVLRPHGKTIGPDFLSQLIAYFTNESWAKYWYTFWAILGTSFVAGLLNPWLGYKSIGFFYMLSVIAVGMLGSLGAVLFSAFLSALIWDFYFIPPQLNFSISHADDILMIFSFFVVAIITGALTQRIRLHEKILREREERTQTLYEVLQDITNAAEASDYLPKSLDRLRRLFEADCDIFLKNSDGSLNLSAEDQTISLHKNDLAIAQWSFDNNEIAGWSTDTLSQSSSFFIPLKGSAETMGVFVFKPHNKKRKLLLDQENLLHSILVQISTSLEREAIKQRLHEAQKLEESEKLHQTLLNSISHELRTPLTAIMGSATSLENEALTGGNIFVKEVGHQLQDSADRLNRVIENLLDMSRLNSGVLSLKLEWHDFSDLISVVTKKFPRLSQDHPLEVIPPENIPLVQMDFRLMEHAVSNLLVNSLIYTPPGTKIRISYQQTGNVFRVVFEDDGPGIPSAFTDKIFEKFYRVPGSPTGGTGLGLSIVKNIIELHQGELKFENAQPHGARFIIDLPAETTPALPEEPS